MLDTDSDINKRKQLCMAMYNKYKDKLQNKKLSLTIRMRIFNAFIRPVFMYNSELWTLTKKTENVIDTFHRNLLRKILNIHYPHIITNIDLLKRTNETAWTQIITVRRLRWTGHFLRTNEQTPVWLVYKEYNRVCEKKNIGNKKTWTKQINNDLQEVNHTLSLEKPNIRASRKLRVWREEVVNQSLPCKPDAIVQR